MTIAQAAARLTLFDRLNGTHGRTEASRRVYGTDTTGQLYRDRAAVVAPARIPLTPSRTLPARTNSRPLAATATALTDVNARADRRAERLAIDHLIAKTPALVRYGIAPPAQPVSSPTIASFAGHRQFETPVANPAAVAAAIVAAGERRRNGTGSARKLAKPSGVAAEILAAGRHRRGEI